jgi:preprotein translocase SecE subunit
VSEIKKIVWCPWKQVRKNSLVVLAVVIACAIVICALDIAFSKALLGLGTLI